DGVADGDEINIYHTDPLKFDTDGDGHGDGEELFWLHTDPLDPNSPPSQSTGDQTSGDQSSGDQGSGGQASGDQSFGGQQTDAQSNDIPVATCGDFASWYDAQNAYEAAGRTSAAPALVESLDPDRNGIACENMMQS